MHAHLKCPKCTQEFDYEVDVASSLRSLHLGGSRYMACPSCGRWSVFAVRANLVPE
jgi:DNA-directed RNA polymerase subunit RPC12/RpoP